MNDQHTAGLEKALAYAGGTHSLCDVADMVEAGDAQYWEEGNAAIVTQLADKPHMRVLHFWLVTGDLDDVIALSERIIDWGRRVGCKRATLAGRKGWEKVLAGSGWNSELVLMGRDISDGQGSDKDDYVNGGPRPGEPAIRPRHT